MRGCAGGRSTRRTGLPRLAAVALEALKQIPRVHLVHNVRELVAPTDGDNNVTAFLEGLQVVGHLGPEELRRVQRGLVDRYGHSLGFHRFHDALDGTRAGASELIFIVRQHIAHREVLADGVGFHYGPGQVLRHVLVDRLQLLGAL